MDKAQYYTRQISFTEWFAQIQHARTDEMREEDNEKRERLKVLYEIIGLPYDKPVQFEATDIAELTPSFQKYLNAHGDILCAMRLIPRDPKREKLRIRGKTVRDSLEWFRIQDIDPSFYRVDFVPHSEQTLWSTCFIVNKGGIFGEIIRDAHTHLTQGFYGEKIQPIAFYFNWHDWRLAEQDDSAHAHLRKITNFLHVDNPDARKRIENKFNATFYQKYIGGYFETVTTKEHGTWFIDYNRVLGDLYHNYIPQIKETNHSKEVMLNGMPANGGVTQGRVRIVAEKDIAGSDFKEGDILVCDMTSPLYIPLMQKANAIVTDRGGILSHAAIVSRELGKPCVTATKHATKTLQNGDMIEVNADKGTITKLK